MKTDAIFSYVLAILEGGLSGMCFYRAGQAKEKKHKVILYIAGALWFAASVIDALTGGRELREALETGEEIGESDF